MERARRCRRLSDIYQGPQYIDVVERNISPPDSVPLVSTYIWNFDTSHLFGTQEEKGEISLDQKMGSVGFILTAWIARAKGTPRSEELPAVINRYEWTNWPSAEGEATIDTIYTESPGTAFYRNAGKYRKYGVEFTTVTKRIEKISTSFRVASAYVRSQSGAEGIYMSTPKQIQLDPADPSSKRYIYPYYYYTEGWNQKLLVDYSADWIIRKLGMWVTFFVQQTLFDWSKDYVDPIRDVPMYFDPVEGRLVSITSRAIESVRPEPHLRQLQSRHRQGAERPAPVQHQRLEIDRARGRDLLLRPQRLRRRGDLQELLWHVQHAQPRYFLRSRIQHDPGRPLETSRGRGEVA